MAAGASVLDATAAVRPLNHSCELCLVLSSVKACARESVEVEVVLYLILTKIFS